MKYTAELSYMSLSKTLPTANIFKPGFGNAPLKNLRDSSIFRIQIFGQKLTMSMQQSPDFGCIVGRLKNALIIL